MGKPRLIIVIRHAQSEGNRDRQIHQLVPDHRVKLTDEGWRQAEEAGHRLRALLNPDDTLQIYTSPYRRTRETTEGILSTLTSKSKSKSKDDADTSSPPAFERSKIKVYEEPRLREQDFGNFQPCSTEMERMWQERADYGHFFYRIPNGESAADAYDRVSGFNESLWRSFGEGDFPSVCVLVTHGLMTRVFLMKWYHWSVEYFEDLRNINHCEFITMNQDSDNGKYILENQLRTWSALKKQKAEEALNNPQRRNTLSHFLTKEQESPSIPPRKWGGCTEGCDHHHERFPRRKVEEEAVASGVSDIQLPPAAAEQRQSAASNDSADSALPEPDAPAPSDTDGTADVSSASVATPVHSAGATLLTSPGRSGSGANTPHERSDQDEYFQIQNPAPAPSKQPRTQSLRRLPQRQATQDDIDRWASESGMGRGGQADTLGDGEIERGEDSLPPSHSPKGPLEGVGSSRKHRMSTLEGPLEEAEDEDGAQVLGERLEEEVAAEMERIRRSEAGVGESVY